ncbi:putative metallodependent hydrolase [Methylocella tundrae]|uniref:Putative metallodependent hydrolase n=1 Tax=Methylocella tundrae TaxID=227605 RepID=A0A8B6MBV4_METTU|nr:TatD family hydrolase [Methylocella tundrae]VTZ28512.1 Hydrolase, TatD family [Methylocella tundrae]VTZ52394.1 putative metallodependent hydrolase [Methylocella tundrae]
MLIDSHCHLDFPDFAPERDAVVQRARAAGVARMVTISTRLDRFAEISALAEAYEDVFCTVGEHPENVREGLDIDFDRIVGLANHPKCVGIGETGLDYHYDGAPRDVAERTFRTHIAAARQTGLPLVIHSREADQDMASILEDEMGKGRFKAVLHCFTSSLRLAETGLALGLSISFSGIVTFKKSQELREIARVVPMDRLLIETDAPFLAPVPHRGKRNEPAFVAATAMVLAEVKGVSLVSLAQQTSLNALRLFSKMTPPAAGEVAAE